VTRKRTSPRSSRASEPDPEELPALEELDEPVADVRTNGSRKSRKGPKRRNGSDGAPGSRGVIPAIEELMLRGADELPPIELLEPGVGRSAELTDEELEPPARSSSRRSRPSACNAICAATGAAVRW
jgi:hypothetical protein